MAGERDYYEVLGAQKGASDRMTRNAKKNSRNLIRLMKYCLIRKKDSVMISSVTQELIRTTAAAAFQEDSAEADSEM